MTQITAEKTIYQLNVFFSNSDVNLVMQFRDMETAKSTAQNIITQVPQGKIMISDHFGHEASLDTVDVILAIATDLKRELQAQEEIQMLRAIAQAKLQKRAQNDPVLRLIADSRIIN